ncbi:MAG: hypothetical protein M5U15_03255 [Kiritimatiellae bacterium]|nr:hypothetical protein [Kiritimatiellia bacterium]
MKMKCMMLVASLVGVGLLVGTGCDWSSGGDSLNTSQGAGVNINFSGVYNGNIGGRAVDRTSAGNISHLTIRQSGNRIEVVDSQGSHYSGSVGAPGVVSQPTGDGGYPLAQSWYSPKSVGRAKTASLNAMSSLSA